MSDTFNIQIKNILKPMSLDFDFTNKLVESEYSNLLHRILSYTLREAPETIYLLDFYSEVSPERLTNQHIFSELCWVVYSSGFRYDIVQKYWPAITEAYQHFEVMQVARMIKSIDKQTKKICKTSGFKNLRKAEWCIRNARRIVELDFEKRSVSGLSGYFANISKKSSLDLVKLAPELVKELKFKGIGTTTIFHLLKNLGFDIFKPDIHVRRVLSELKLISNEESPISEISDVMKQLSTASDMKITELDTLLFTYGRITGDKIHELL